MAAHALVESVIPAQCSDFGQFPAKRRFVCVDSLLHLHLRVINLSRYDVEMREQ